MILSLISQKGGVGKSTLSRLLAAEFVRAGWAVMVADLDPAQGTATKWAARRAQAKIKPAVYVKKYRDAGRAVADAAGYDLAILDGPAHSDRSAAIMGNASDLILLPTGYSVDDLEPQVQAAYDLENAGVDPARIRLAICRARGSARDEQAARDYIRRAGLLALDATVRELPSIAHAHALGRTAAETGRQAVDDEGRAVAAEVSKILTQGGK